MTLDCLAAGVVGTSGVFYSVWLYNLFQSGRVSHLSHLALTVVANGTRIFRLLALSGSLMAWRATHQAVGLVAREVMMMLHSLLVTNLQKKKLRKSTLTSLSNLFTMKV